MYQHTNLTTHLEKKRPLAYYHLKCVEDSRNSKLVLNEAKHATGKTNMGHIFYNVLPSLLISLIQL